MMTDFKLKVAAQQSVQPTSGMRRVFWAFGWLGVGSVSRASLLSTRLQLTQAVRRVLSKSKSVKIIA